MFFFIQPSSADLCSQLSSLPSTLHTDPSVRAKDAEICLREMVELVQAVDGLSEASKIVNKWFLLENEPEIIAGMELARADDINQDFDAAAVQHSQDNSFLLMDQGTLVQLNSLVSNFLYLFSIFTR